ncbi:MAG: cytochrome b [Bdellovibrio bacteriovorus]
MNTTAASTFRYTLIQRLLHWLIVLLAFGLLGVGLTLGNLGYEGTVAAFGSDTTNLLYTYHKTFGVLLLGLMVLRVLLRVTVGTPPYRQPLAAWQAAASKVVHGLFYLVLFALPVVGWLGTAAGGFPVQFFGWELPGLIGKDEDLGKALFEIHGWLGWILIALIVIHVAAALMHWLIQRDGVVERMSLLR